MKQLYKLFLGVDATQVEVNPFGETPDGRGILMDCINRAARRVFSLLVFICLGVSLFLCSRTVLCFDAKIVFDDNASFRQEEIFAMRDTAEEASWCTRQQRGRKFSVSHSSPLFSGPARS